MRVFVPYNAVDNDDEVVIKCSVNGGDWEEKDAIFQPGLLKDLKVHITIARLCNILRFFTAVKHMSRVMREQTFLFPTWSDTN